MVRMRHGDVGTGYGVLVRNPWLAYYTRLIAFVRDDRQN